MFLGFLPLDVQVFDINLSNNEDYNKINLENCKIDKIKADKDLIGYSNEEEQILDSTVLLAEFKGSLEADVEDYGIPTFHFTRELY